MVDVTEKVLKRYESLIVDAIKKIAETNNVEDIMKYGSLLERLTFVYTDINYIRGVGGQIVVPEESLGKLNLAS